MFSKNKNSIFPSPYATIAEKNTDEYAVSVFNAVLDSTAMYREERSGTISNLRRYARGKQSLKQYLDELNIEGNKQYVNISYTPTPILSKFEKVVVDDYQQLQEEVRAIAKSYAIRQRKERKKSDMRFGMEYRDMISQLEQEIGFPIEDPSVQVPEDEEELELITSLQPDEREELLMNELVEKVLEDNDIDAMKRKFLSDIFQVNTAGYHVYRDNNNRIQVDYIAVEDAIYPTSTHEEISKDGRYFGKSCLKSISEIRSEFSVSPEQEKTLHKLAFNHRSSYGNNSYGSVSSGFNIDWRYSSTRPYDDYLIPVYHIWIKTLKNVGFVEGKDSYGKTIFDIDYSVNTSDYRPENKNKRTGVVYPETSFEGWFAGDSQCSIVLEWGESSNQTRKGKNSEQVIPPYVYFMPDNRGSMDEDSAVGRVIPEINMLDLTTLKIKLAIARHVPSGYALDVQALMDVDLGNGDVSPLELDDIYQQTSRLYFSSKKESGENNNLPIVQMPTDLASTIQGYLLIYNNSMNNIRDILGVNLNRDGSANLNRVSTANANQQLAISQTATYYMYRAYIKATEKLIWLVGQHIWNSLKYGDVNDGYLNYIGEGNLDFIKEREDITQDTYEYKLSVPMSQEDKMRIDESINICLQAGTLQMPDAIMIRSVKDITIAEKMLQYLYKKRQKEQQQMAIQNAQQQAEATAQAGVAVEQEKQNSIQIQGQFDIERARINSEGEKERALAQVVSNIIKANMEDGVPIPPMYQPLVDAYIESHTIRQERQQAEEEIRIADEMNQLQQEQQAQQLEQQIANGDITEEEAVGMIQQQQPQ